MSDHKKNEWRYIVSSTMRAAAEEEANGLLWPQNSGLDHEKQSENGFNYRWEHVKTVVTLAIKLASLVGADREVVEAAAWLHDVAKIRGESHAQAGADIAREILATTDFPEEKIDRVARAIDAHEGLWLDEPLTELEAMVLWDADKLTKIGLTAAVHWTALTVVSGNSVTTTELIANNQVDWQAKTVSSMHTRPARHAARKRLAAFETFWRDLANELAGRDLIGR